MNERLSPKKAPPTTMATSHGVPQLSTPASSVTIGIKATIVPTDVPMAIDIKQAATNIPAGI